VLTSVVLPLFGTGQGGLSASEVIGLIVDGITGFFDDLRESGRTSEVTNVIISAFTRKDVEAVVEALDARLGRSSLKL
jgi:hypothetical protein